MNGPRLTKLHPSLYEIAKILNARPAPTFRAGFYPTSKVLGRYFSVNFYEASRYKNFHD